MSDRLSLQPIEPITGASIQAFAFVEDESGVVGEAAPMVARGTGFNFDSNYGVFPVQELGKASPTESAWGASGGINFTIARVIGTNQNAEQYLPNTDENLDTHLLLNDLTIKLMVTHGKYAGKQIGELRGCKIRSKSGSLNPDQLYSGQIRGWAKYFNNNPEFTVRTTEPSVDSLPEVA